LRKSCKWQSRNLFTATGAKDAKEARNLYDCLCSLRVLCGELILLNAEC
jgi:hypothetical protein